MAMGLLRSLLSFTLGCFVSCTDLFVTYEHSVHMIKSADSGNFSDLVRLATPLHFPQGLAYRPPAEGDDGGALFVSDTQSGKASVFALELTDGNATARRYESLIKWSPKWFSHAAYNLNDNSLFVSSSFPVPGVSRSMLSHDTAEHWSPEPSPVVAAASGTVRGIALDHCNEKLFWSETSNSSSSVHVLLTSQLSSEARALPLSPSSFYQGLHYDESSESLIIAVTDTDNATISSCSFISYGESAKNVTKQEVASETSEDEPSHKISVIAENIPHCYPYSLSADQDFIYFSDWSRNGIMRFRKTDPTDLVKLHDTPPSESLKQLRFGAYDVLALNRNETQTKRICHQSETATAEQPLPKITPSLANDGITENTTDAPKLSTSKLDFQNGDTFKPLLSSEKNINRFVNEENVSTSPATFASRSGFYGSNEKPMMKLDQKRLSNMDPPLRDNGEELKTVRIGAIFSYTDTPNALATDMNTALEDSDHALPKYQYKIEPRHAQNPPDVGHYGVKAVRPHHYAVWLPDVSREDLVCAVFVLMGLCSVLLAVSTVLAVRQFRSWSRSSTLNVSRPDRDGRAYKEVSKFANRSCVNPGTRSTHSECGVSAEGRCNGRTDGTTDVIIDLSSQDDIKVSSDLHDSAGRARRKKKTFGPKNGFIKHLISKSFAKDGRFNGSTGCPGLQSNDGVTLNIEDCCQMTLCETPCYTSVRKEGKDYLSSGAAADDDRRILLDDEQHTFC